MKFSPDAAKRSLTPGLDSVLADLREADRFDADSYLREKARRLNQYFRQHGLKAAVVAVSGGVDSALVLALMRYTMRQPDSPLMHVVPVLLPVYDPRAATNQETATRRGKELCAAFGLNPLLIDLTSAHNTTAAAVSNVLRKEGTDWARGQLVAYQRTPALYYVTSLLAEQWLPSVLVGTTNYDEGAYLGYFGKASDGLVDLQPISDLHKHRVFELARKLGVPDSILNAVPTGDMYDGRVDEEVFGACYDFVELFLRCKRDPEQTGRRLAVLESASTERFSALSQNLEDLHRYNQHKYYGRSPAVHFDLWDGSFPGSWQYFVWPAQA